MVTLSRRSFFSAAGIAGGGAALAACERGVGRGETLSTGSDVVSPFGAHQAGITTPAQRSLAFASFDMAPGATRKDLESMLARWTSAIARMTAGKLLADDEGNPSAAPQDTGEALDLTAGNLTVTVGFGPSLFDHRFGLSDKRPAALADIPHLPGDQLDPTRSNGDLCVQACADDPQVAFHAMRNLRRLATGNAQLRWTQLGFGKTSSTSRAQATPRNLMGFKDGTNNITSEETQSLADHVWVGSETDQPWMRGGTYMVTRRIQMLLESWDRDRLSDQEAVIGRFKDTGAPLTGSKEHDVPDYAPDTIGMAAHIRLAAPINNNGLRLLRRGYSFTDGTRPDTGQLDAGLFFIAFQKDPRTQFVPLQLRLSQNDALNEYVRHASSAVFAVPPGISAGGTLGSTLLS